MVSCGGISNAPLMLAGWKVDWEESQNNLDEIKSMLLSQHGSIPVSMGFSYISILIKGVYGNRPTDILRIGHLVYLFNESLCLVNGTWSTFCGVLLSSDCIPFMRGPTTYLSSRFLNHHFYFVHHQIIRHYKYCIQSKHLRTEVITCCDLDLYFLNISDVDIFLYVSWPIVHLH